MNVPNPTDGLSSPSHAQQHADLINGKNINDASADTPLDADEFSFWDVVSGGIKKITWSNIKATLKTYFDTLYPAKDGWQAVSDSWSYASASTITVPSGAASLYKVGDKIKWTQTTVKYGVIRTVADTLLTIIVNTDYVVTNAVDFGYLCFPSRNSNRFSRCI